MSTLASVSSYAELKRMGEGARPYVCEEVFPEEGRRARSLSKKRFRMLQRLDPLLDRMLADGERVHFATWGMEYAFWEQYFLGLWALLVNRRVLVVTDRRLLLLQVHRGSRPGALKAQIEYRAVARATTRSFGFLLLELRDGKKVTLSGVPGPDRKRLLAAVERFRGQGGAALPGRVGRQNLCPHCCATVAGLPAACPHCHRPFKSARRAFYRSLVFPGLGDLYLGLRGLGAVEMLGAALVWTGVAAVALIPGDHEPLTALELGVIAGLVVVLVHGPDALVTRHTALKGLYPEER